MMIGTLLLRECFSLCRHYPLCQLPSSAFYSLLPPRVESHSPVPRDDLMGLRELKCLPGLISPGQRG